MPDPMWFGHAATQRGGCFSAQQPATYPAPANPHPPTAQRSSGTAQKRVAPHSLGIIKSMKRVIAIAVFASLVCGQVSAGTTACVLPVADGRDVEPSPASVQGVIAKVIRGQITLKGKKSQHIRFGKETELFTVYGGAVDAAELKPGQHVFVWYVGCKEVPGATPMAAIIQLCSAAAEPCLK